MREAVGTVGSRYCHHVTITTLHFGSMFAPDFAFTSRRSPVLSRHGMVACTQPLAAEIGLSVLKAGGNAVDAAVAVAAAMNGEDTHHSLSTCGIDETVGPAVHTRKFCIHCCRGQ